MEVDSVVSSTTTTSSMIPLSMWESMQSWLTPTILFLLLNLMIATIALTSSSLSSNPTNNKDKNNTPTDSTSSSNNNSPLFHRLRSINLSPFKSFPETHNSVVVQPSLDDEPFNTIAAREVTRTLSSDAAEPAAPPLAARIKKSASMKSPFAHFKDADVAADVEARRPATVRERRREKKDREGDEEVDAKADDFINRFKNQLKLQRMDSIVRYKEMIGRGAGEN